MRSPSSWSTHGLPVPQRLRGWRDALHATVLEMDAVPLRRDGFFGRIERCALQGVRPHQAQGAPRRVPRSAAGTARGQHNADDLLSQPRLPWRATQAGPTLELRPGDAVLIDARLPDGCAFGAGLDDLSIGQPIAWVAQWVGAPRPCADQLADGLADGLTDGLARRGRRPGTVRRTAPPGFSQTAWHTNDFKETAWT